MTVHKQPYFNKKHKHVIKTKKLRVVNIVCTFNLGCLLDVEELANACELIISAPNAFASGVGRFVDPSCVFSVFSTGNVTIAGLKSHTAAYFASAKLCHIIRTIGKKPLVGIHQFKIINSTLSTSMGSKIDIYKMQQENPFIVLNHRTFPNVTLRSQTTISITVPISGKVNVVGGKTIKISKEAFDNALPNILKYSII